MHARVPIAHCHRPICAAVYHGRHSAALARWRTDRHGWLFPVEAPQERLEARERGGNGRIGRGNLEVPTFRAAGSSDEDDASALPG